MANGRRFVTELAWNTGRGIPGLQRLITPLRKAGLVPVSGTGSASDRVHLGANHATHLLLALAADGSTTVLNDVRQLGALEPAHPEPGDFGTLHHALTGEIDLRARCIFNGQRPTGPYGENWRLTLCVDPVSGWIEWTENGEPRRRDFVAPNVKQKHLRTVRRLTVIDGEILNALAELCADSLAHAARKNETAAPGRAAAQSRSRRTTHLVDTGRPTEIFGWPQGRPAHAPVKHEQVRSDDERPNSAGVVGG